MSIARHALVVFVALLIVGCGSDDADGGPGSNTARVSGRAVLADRAKVLDEAELRALSSVLRRGELVELVFSTTSPMLKEVVAGDVLILGISKLTPDGALLTVETVTAQGERLVAQTRPAALVSAFKELKVDLAATLAKPTHTSLTAGSGAVTRTISESRQALGLTFPIDLSEGSGANRIALEGSLSLDSSLDLTLDFDFAALELKELGLTFGAEETFFAELVGQGQSTIAESVTLGSISFAPITLILPIPVPPGAVPVVLTPRVALEAGVKGSIQGEVQASVLQEASFTAGIGYRNGEFGGLSDSESTFDAEQPTYAAGVNVRAWAGPRMEVLLYGAVGPFARVDGFVELAANVEGPPPCATGVVNAGLTANVGVDFLASYETTLFDVRHPLAHFDSCTNDPNAPRPAITWARSFGRVGSSGETAKAVIEAADGS